MIQIIGVIATKNRNELLKRALTSAINQTRKLDELIVVSDSDERDFQKIGIYAKVNAYFLEIVTQEIMPGI